MKSLLKFAVLSALLIGGKLAKQPAPTMSTRLETTPDGILDRTDNSVVLVHQVLTSEPVRPALQQTPMRASGSGIIAEMF